MDNEELTLILSERRLDADAAPRLEAELKRNLDGVKRLTVDMSAVIYISSAGLRALLSAQHTMGEGSSVTLRNVCGDVMHTLEITGFAEIFTVQQ